MSLDMSNPMPLWAQLVAELRRRLGAGDFDERFPTEAELVVAFGVSRATVREAIRRLRGDGLLDARRGSGTFVVRRQLDAPILGTSGLAQAITAAGLVEASRVLRIEEGQATRTASRSRWTGPRWRSVPPNGGRSRAAISHRGRSTACSRRSAVCG